MFFELKTYTNPILVTISLIEKLGVKVCRSTINDSLLSHPNYPSILSISDVLTQWKIENRILKVEKDRLLAIPTPFITIVNEKGRSFITVTKVTKTEIFYNGSKGKKISTKGLKEFTEIWDRIIISASPSVESGEENFLKKSLDEFFKKIRLVIFFIATTLIFCGSLFYLFTSESSAKFIYIYATFFILDIVGIIICYLLVLQEIDKYNPLVQRICSMGRKTSCSAILESKGAKIYGLSWSEIGLFYFMGGLLFLILSVEKFHLGVYFLVILSIITLPYTLFSIFYQWKIVKQWCILCLFVQSILLTELIFSLSSFNILSDITNIMFSGFVIISRFIFSYALSIIVWYLIKPILIKLKEVEPQRTQYLRLKFDHRIFENILNKQKFISCPPEGLGITIGNVYSKNKVIKICNPYCSPCAKSHEQIEALLAGKVDIKIQIIFTASSDKDDERRMPVKHLLAIAEIGNHEITRLSLHDWYSSEKKEYKKFEEKYKNYTNLEMQEYKIAEMRKWCDEIGIAHTPTFFINGFELPDLYSIEDIKYFFLV